MPDHERHDLGATRGRFARDGCLYLRSLLNPERVLAFRRFSLESLAPHGLLRQGPDLLEGVAGEAPDLAKARRVLFDEIVPGPQ